MKMKSFLMLLVISVLFSCSSQAGYVLKGVFKGAGNGRAVLSVNGVNQQMISDTVEMKEGTFVFEGEVPGSRVGNRGGGTGGGGDGANDVGIGK